MSSENGISAWGWWSGLSCHIRRTPQYDSIRHVCVLEEQMWLWVGRYVLMRRTPLAWVIHCSVGISGPSIQIFMKQLVDLQSLLLPSDLYASPAGKLPYGKCQALPTPSSTNRASYQNTSWHWLPLCLWLAWWELWWPYIWWCVSRDAQTEEVWSSGVNSLASKQDPSYSGKEQWRRYINHLPTAKDRFQCKYQLFWLWNCKTVVKISLSRFYIIFFTSMCLM